jgi:hypothetical protein
MYITASNPAANRPNHFETTSDTQTCTTWSIGRISSESSAQSASLLWTGDSLTQKAINDDYAVAHTRAGSSCDAYPEWLTTQEIFPYKRGVFR